MCGIAGVLGPAANDRIVMRMVDALRHRGPDDLGQQRLTDGRGEQRGIFGHVRLSILDLSSAGHQPMSTPDGRFTITYNGEVYNFLELRRELRQEGAQFRTETDTEVVLLGCALHGISYAAKLRGMFAFALWDRETGTCWLVRDAFGIKPLYYTVLGDSVVFASEVRGMLASGIVPKELSRQGIASYLTAGSVQEPWTVVDNVYSVQPGGAIGLRTQGNTLSVEREEFIFEITLDADQRVTERREAIKVVRSALEESVRCHMVSDVPISFFLSGGLDSSAIVALASSIGVASLETFTVTFQEDQFNEAPAARAVAQKFGTNHHEIPLSAGDLLKELPAAFTAMDQPSMDGINTYFVSRAVAQHGLKVVLSGLGADELFGGYSSFRRARTARRLHTLPRYARESLARIAVASGDIRGAKMAMMLRGATPAAAAYRASRTLLPETDVARLTGIAAEIPCGVGRGNDDLEEVARLELSGYMRGTLLRDTDAFSMAHALEVRVPFVDLGVARAVTRIEPAIKWAGEGSKPLLRETVRELLPEAAWRRPKQGFTLPWEIWLREPMREEVSTALTETRMRRVGIDAAFANEIWSRFLRRRGGVGWSRPWAIYTLVRWSEQNGLTMGDLRPIRVAS